MSAIVLLALLCVCASCVNTAGGKPTPETARRGLIFKDIPFDEKSFVDSATGGDLLAVNLFLAADMTPNARNERRETPLIVAAEKDYQKIVGALLANGADVNAVDEN
ncbi:MAG: hypothetical protein ACR2LC_14435, partial [Pyrinomonadaceae bacterium]